MSGDPAMLKAILDDLDLHCFTASIMYNIPYTEFIAAKKKSKEENAVLTEREKDLLKKRQEAKTIGFGILYGAGPVKIGKELGIAKNIAKEKISSYFQVFPGVEAYMGSIIDECYQNGYVTTISGRRRRLQAGIYNDNFEQRSHAEREAVNVTIQGSAADIVKNAMLRIEECTKMRRYRAQILNQIHDELVIEVPKEYAEVVAEMVRDYMEHPFGGNTSGIRVPLPVDLKIVNRWSEAKG
jgi:DNA polymerase-1